MHDIDGVPVRIYGLEKTIADCLKYRNKFGLDVAIEALRLWRHRLCLRPDVLLDCARVDRVERIIRPYHEALI